MRVGLAGAGPVAARRAPSGESVGHGRMLPPMPRSLPAYVLTLGSLLGLLACDERRTQPEPAPPDAAASRDVNPTPAPTPASKGPPMPETFVAFTRPELAALDGAWLVESEIVGRRALWLIEEAGAKLTEIDHRGRERVYGLALASPCALRMTDEDGLSRTRAIAMAGDQLVITRMGATAVVGEDGSMLACAGPRTYQIAADGRCRFTTEMLGAWTDPATPVERCELGRDEQGRLLRVGEQVLREVDGLWVDPLAATGRATKVVDREAGLAALAEVPASEVEAAAGEAAAAP